MCIRDRFKNEPLIAKRNRYDATCRMVTGMAHLIEYNTLKGVGR